MSKLKHKEHIIEKNLRLYLEKNKKLEVINNQKNIKSRDGSIIRPDIIAFRRKTNVVYIYECKDTTKINGVIKTFAQLLATKFVFDRLDKNSKIRIRKITKKKNPEYKFRIAFGERAYNNKITKKLIKNFRNKYFKEFKACFVLNNGKVIQAQRAINKK